MEWEYTTCFVEISIFKAFLVEAILILEVSKTYHINTAKVLIKELTSTLLIYFFERRSMIDSWSTYVRTNLVEQRLRSITICSLGTTCDSLSLHHEDISIPNERNIIRLVTSVLEVVIDYKPLDGAVALTPSLNIVTNIKVSIILN